MKNKNTSCETCANYVYDEDAGEYFCDVNMDEDDMARLLSGGLYNCPYYDFYDEYSIVKKQN